MASCDMLCVGIALMYMVWACLCFTGRVALYGGYSGKGGYAQA